MAKVNFEVEPEVVTTELATFTRFHEKEGLPFVLVKVQSSLADMSDRWLMVAKRSWGDEIVYRSKGKGPAVKAARDIVNGKVKSKPPKRRARKF